MLNAAAAAIAWLAQKGVVYTDLRGPNVVVDASGDPWLVGFDDCLAIDESVGTLAAYKKHLAASPDEQREATLAARLTAGALPAVKGALEAAFTSAAGGSA